LARALAWHARGQEFKSPWVHKRKTAAFRGFSFANGDIELLTKNIENNAMAFLL
jgi:hypothetical protein